MTAEKLGQVWDSGDGGVLRKDRALSFGDGREKRRNGNGTQGERNGGRVQRRKGKVCGADGGVSRSDCTLNVGGSMKVTAHCMWLAGGRCGVADVGRRVRETEGKADRRRGKMKTKHGQKSR